VYLEVLSLVFGVIFFRVIEYRDIDKSVLFLLRFSEVTLSWRSRLCIGESKLSE